MWGLDWQIWAIIMFTLFWVSIATIILCLYVRIRALESEDTVLSCEERKLNIKNGKLALHLKLTEYSGLLPDKLSKELEE